MSGVAAWIAPAATMIAAMMTAANLGARLTGWGFIVFTIGSIAWVVVAIGSGQTNLLVTNALLAVVNLVGVWRWLGLRARSDDAAEAEETRSGRERRPDLFPATSLEGMKIEDATGNAIARVTEAMTRSESGVIDHLIVRVGGVGGVGATLRRLDWSQVVHAGEVLRVEMHKDEIARLPLADPSGG